MRRKFIGLVVLAGVAGIVLSPTLGVSRVNGQSGPQGGGKIGGGGGFGGGFNPAAMFGGKMGGGNNAGKGGNGLFSGGTGMANGFLDPDRIFDFIAKGSDAIVIANVGGFMQGPLQQFAQDSGNTTGIITRQQFADAVQSFTAKLQTGGFASFGGGNNFNPTRRQSDGGASFGNAFTPIEEEWDKPPVVFRAGKLPLEFPAWFPQCDKDNDGQVALSEWRQYSGKSIAEFQQMDRNGDGLLTVEEVMWFTKLQSNSSSGTLADNSSPSNPSNKGGFGNGGFKGGKSGGFGQGGGGFGSGFDPAAFFGGKKGGGKAGGFGQGGFGGGFDPKAFDPAAFFGGKKGGGKAGGFGGGFDPKAFDPAAFFGGKKGG